MGHPSYTIYHRCDDCGADIEEEHLEGCIYLDYDDDEAAEGVARAWLFGGDE